MIRPEALTSLLRAQEVIFAFVLGLCGVWLLWLGGWILGPVGGLALGLAALLGLTGLRRLRFQQEITAPGVVEVVEGEVRYMGPEIGGFVSLAELAEVRLLTLRGRRLWRLKQADGQALLVPIDATGADALFDAFQSLPGMNMAALLQSLSPTGAAASTKLASAETVAMQPIWRRGGKGIVPEDRG